ncbi:relaxin receptor 2a isoform X2 [Brienomyrus brachyistius]|uniref:relaxin receptor 2a isoform X2 n=1 Tax=Brienomyrus brachyistius TaxID=42636 RepID=UPI0020B3DDFC|nr:relaxin receptor 2a isoform X2 [Brienomyrus brachyistius]
MQHLENPHSLWSLGGEGCAVGMRKRARTTGSSRPEMLLCMDVPTTVLIVHLTLTAIAGEAMMASRAAIEGCPLGQFPCGNLSVCLPQVFQCNGQADCQNGADEENCGDNSGWAAFFDQTIKRVAPQEFRRGCFLEQYPDYCSCIETSLQCVSLKLKEVPPVSANVTSLSLRSNEIRKLQDGVFSMFSELQRLFLQNNGIRIVSGQAFRGLHQLRKLSLSQNNITSLRPGVFNDLHKLHWLILDDNPLKRVQRDTFLGLTSLFFLSMVNTSLVQLPEAKFCHHMPALSWLDFEGNRIQTFKFSVLLSCEELTVLCLRDNNISVLQENTFQPLRDLGELDLSSNQITELPSDIFRGLKSLQTLNISHNPLVRIHPGQFDPLVYLQSLSLEGIEIPDIQTRMFQSMKNLSHILYSHRYFKKFQYCSYAPHVRKCKPNSDGISSIEDLLASVILRVSVWVMAFITCFGNLFVIGMRSVIRAENNLHAMCIKVLCYCLMGVYLFLVGVFDVKFRGEYNRNAKLWMESSTCHTMGFLAMLSSEVSVMLITYLTMEKFLAIVFPFSRLRPGKRQTACMLASIWLLGTAIAAIPLLDEGLFGNYYGRNGVCFPLHSDRLERPIIEGYSTSIFLGLNLAAFLVIVVSYSSMFYSIYKTGLNAADLSSRLHRDIAIANRFFFIVFSNALCWIPIFLVKILSMLEVEIPGHITSWVVIFILPINSALNPILYTLTTSFFREQVEMLLYRWQRHRIVQRDRKSLTSSGLYVEASQRAYYHPQPCLPRTTLDDINTKCS